MTDSEKIQAIQTKMQDILIVGGQPVKNTSRKQCYEALEYIQGLLDTNKIITSCLLFDLKDLKISILMKENEVLEKALELACETITEEGCDNCEFRFKCKKYYGGSTLEDCRNTFIEQAKESLK